MKSSNKGSDKLLAMVAPILYRTNKIYTREAVVDQKALQGVFSRKGLRKVLDLPARENAKVKTVTWGKIVRVLRKVNETKAGWLSTNLLFEDINLSVRIPIRDAEVTEENVEHIVGRASLEYLTKDPCAGAEALLAEADAVLKNKPRPEPVDKPVLVPGQLKNVFVLMRQALDENIFSPEDHTIVDEVYWYFQIFTQEGTVFNQKAIVETIGQERFQGSFADWGNFIARMVHRGNPRRNTALVGSILHYLVKTHTPQQIGEAAFAAMQLLAPSGPKVACTQLGTLLIFPLHADAANKDRLAQYAEAIKGMS